MGAANKLNNNDFKTLGNFTLLNALDTDKLSELTQKSTLKKFAAGASLPTKNLSYKTLYYLLSGTIEITRRGKTEQIEAGKKNALNPICYQEPQSIAIAKSPVSVICVDAELLELLQHWDNNSASEIEETNVPATAHWVNVLLQNQALLKLSPNKLQSLIATIEPIETKQGETIIKQGDRHDANYYIIAQGHCVVSRRASPNAKNTELASLNPGQGFGEEALISDTPRNATVTMSSDGLLLRISQKNFSQLLENTFVKKVAYTHAGRMKEQGAETLDARPEAAFINNGIGTHTPLNTLRLQAQRLDKNKKYIVVCEDGKKSAAATFILSQQGFDVYALSGGLEAIEETNTVAPLEKKTIAIVNDEYAVEHFRWRACEIEQRIQRLEEKYQTEIKQLNQALDIEKQCQKKELKKQQRQGKNQLKQEQASKEELKKQLEIEKTLVSQLHKKASDASRVTIELKQKNNQLHQEISRVNKRISKAKQQTKRKPEEARPFVYVKDDKKPTNKLKYYGIGLILLTALSFYAASYFDTPLTGPLKALISSI